QGQIEMRPLAFLGFVALLAGATAQADPKTALKIENAQVVSQGHEFTEGPTLDGEGNILFTSPRQNAIVRYSIKDGTSSIFYKGDVPVSALFFRDGKLFATQGNLDRVIEIESPDKFVPVVESFEGKPFNKPNDLWVSPSGHIYFTDPNYGRGPLPQGGEYAYWVTPEGTVYRIDATFNRPNGIVGSEDGKTLFITDAGDSKTYRFELDEDGKPGKQKLFTEIGGDGMTLDSKGNLYMGVPRQKALVAIDPDGKEIARIEEFGCTNVTFGPEGKVLYITKSPGLWALRIW
ncbi:MAG: SMP-30/gluconolactonase/LRE family protein, partial [Verrucomicrobiota bacterium]